jgi:MFS family permease
MLNRNKSILSQNHIFFGLVVCTLAAFFYCYEFVLRIIPGILHAELSARFGNISAAMFGQVAALYYFAYSPMQLPVGMLIDRFGPRRLLTIACACCALGSYFFGFSTSLWFVGVGRFMVGFGSSFAFVGVLTLATMWLPKHLFSLFAGLMTTLGMLGNVYAEMKITHMTQTIGIGSVLSSTVFIGAILTLVICFCVRDNKNYMKEHKTSLKPFFKEVVQVLSSYKVWIIGVIGACLYTSLSVFGELWGQTYLEHAHQLTKTESAETMSMLFIGWAIGAPLSGFLSDKFNTRVLPLMVAAVGGLITIYALLYVQNLTLGAIKLLVLSYGLFTSTEIIVFAMAKEISGVKISGTVFAVTNMIVTLIGAIFQPLVGWILDMCGNRVWVTNHYHYQVADYQKALAVLPLSMIVVIVLCFFIKDNKNHLSVV